MPDVVSNTGPLIALAGIGQFNLLHSLFGKILIPPGVHSEILDETSRVALADADWVAIQPVQDTLAVQLLRETLDMGESEAIVLACECNAALVLIDERSATRRARNVGLQTIGTLGVLLMAKRRGYIPMLKPLLDELQNADFHMSDAIYRQALDSAGEISAG